MISAFGVEHGEISKARKKNNNGSTRQAAAYGAGGGLVATHGLLGGAQYSLARDAGYGRGEARAFGLGAALSPKGLRYTAPAAALGAATTAGIHHARNRDKR